MRLRERFEAEDKRLLTAQILMNDAMQKTNIAIEKMAEGVASLELKMEASTARFNALTEETTGKLKRVREDLRLKQDFIVGRFS